MKVFKTPAPSAKDIRTQLTEALLLSRIGHPNVIRVFDANVLERPSGMVGFFTMEYVASGTLDRYWRSFTGRFMPIAEVVAIMRQVCAGIAVAHSETPPIIHRDIKPQNILVGYDDVGLRVRVSDFGLAKQADPLSLLVSSKGTLSFKPPEAFHDMDSAAADVWALGTTLYLLLTDTVPYPELNGRDLNDAGRFVDSLRPASTFNVQVDEELDRIVGRCLTKRPQDRFPHAKALLDELSKWRPKCEAEQMTESSQTTFSRATASGNPQDGTLCERLEAALHLSRSPGNLAMAADLLEQVLADSPELRHQYESQLGLWRRGVCM